MKISNCARCEGNHEVQIKQLKNPILDPVTDIVWATHWTMCPTLNEPIIVFVDMACSRGPSENSD